MYQPVCTILPPNGESFSRLNTQGASYMLPQFQRIKTKVKESHGGQAQNFSGDVMWHYIYFAFKWIGVLLTLTAVICSAFLLSKGLFEDCGLTQCNTRVFTVNTFLTSHEPDTTIGWPVATERLYDPNDLTKTVFTGTSVGTKWSWMQYGDCMYSAGFLYTACNASTFDFATYKTCVEANTNANTLINTCQNSANFMTNQWPTPDRYTECLSADPNILQISRPRLNAFKYCLHNAFWPFYQIPQGIDSRHFLGSYNWVLFIVIALWIMTSFGVYTVYPVDYEAEESQIISDGRPRDSYQRLGFLWAFVPVLWNGILFIFACIVTIRDDVSYWKKDNIMYPTTVPTGIITIVASAFGLFYFLGLASDLYNYGFTFVSKAAVKYQMELNDMDRKKKAAQRILKNYKDSRAGRGALPPGDDQGEDAAGGAESRMDYHGSLMAGPMPQALGPYKVSTNNVASVYVQPLTTVWSDSYLVDPLFVLGILGGIGQLSTEDAWNIFFLVLYYRVCNMILSRLIFESFVTDMSDTAEISHQRNNHDGGYVDSSRRNALFALRVHALAIQIAAWYFVVNASIILYDSNKLFNRSSILNQFMIFGFFIPEAIRSLLHVTMQGVEFFTANKNQDAASAHNKDWGMVILAISQVVWVWDFAVRLSFAMVIYFNTDVNYMGTRMWLNDHYQSLVTTLPLLASA